jgi:hypothetical protein
MRADGLFSGIELCHFVRVGVGAYRVPYLPVIPTFFVRFVILSVLCGLTGTEIEIEVEVSLKPECAARQDFRLVGLGTGKNDAASPKLGRPRRYVTKLTCFHPTRWTPLK